jgi:hypothetical protein
MGSTSGLNGIELKGTDASAANATEPGKVVELISAFFSGRS